MARTVAETDKEYKISTRLPVGFMRDMLAKDEEGLNLAFLPTETSMRVCLMGVNADGDVIVTDGDDIVSKEFGIKGNEVTLRQIVTFSYGFADCGNAVYKQFDLGTKGLVHIGLSREHGRGRKNICLLLDGRSLEFYQNHLSAHLKSAVIKGVSVVAMTKEARDLLDYKTHSAIAFLGQHTIRFPDVYKGREEVSFLGLPKGTKLFTKDGGEFEVLKRDAYHCPDNGLARGCLLLRCLNDEASEVASYEGWNVKVAPGHGGAVLVPDTLLTKRKSSSFVMSRTQVPYRCPLEGVEVLFGQGSVLVSDMGVAVGKGSGGKYFNNTEDLVENLENFLFG